MLLINEGVLLSKTHCTAYCDNCPSTEFVHSLDSFERGCRSALFGPGLIDEYPASLVSKAVHLFRDPFDNLVARKKAGVQIRLRSDPEAWTNSVIVQDTKQGLHAWCKHIDESFDKGEGQASLLDIPTKALFAGVPCASELYKIVAWHNLAIKVTQSLAVPVHYVHYEDYYSEGFYETVRNLTGFLDIDLVQKPNKLLSEKSSIDLFDASEITAIAKFVRAFASPNCWEHVSRYVRKLIPDTDASPRIAWLMSFPNSGTSYTMRNTVSLTNMSVATNYAEEVDDRVVPLRPDLADGPYILHPEMGISPVVLTKTHCNPRHSIANFESGCRTASKIFNGKQIKAHYPAWLVEKVVHLLRSPFDNIVARMHLGVRKQRKKGLSEDILRTFKETREGVRSWCDFLDHNFGGNVKSWVPPKDQYLLDRIPCYSDLLHYVRWHELAIQVYEQYQVPVHVLFYEDYTYKYNETISSLYDFLELPVVGRPQKFTRGKTYKHLFDDNEIEAIAQLIRATATAKCWNILSRYFAFDGSPPLTSRDRNENNTALQR